MSGGTGTRLGRLGRAVVGAALVVAAFVAMGLLTRYGYGADTDAGALRLAWRASVPRVVECRAPTEAELEALPIHMRRDEICEGVSLPYRLTVEVDGEVRHRSDVRAEGARSDRPLQVFEELRLEPGTHRLRVVFERADSAGAADATDAADAAGGTSSPSSLPARLVLDRRLEVGVRDVVLVTYDAGARRLVVRSRAAD